MPSEVEMSNSSQSSSEPTILPAYKQGSLAIPAISAEYERVFSSTKKLLAPERSRPAPDIIEASECLKT
jgi:hAT family C-terminal dimerisation region